jgi:hypothetical protein
MRYLITVVDSISGSGSSDEMAAIDAFNDRLRARGHWVLAGGIEPPERASRIDGRVGVPAELRVSASLADPFVAGFWIIEAHDRAEAERLALEGSRACNRVVEVRAFLQ